MTVFFFANVGQRDLQFDAQPLDKANLRDAAANIRDNYDHFRPRLSAPMLSTCLEDIAKECGAVDEVFLFATDQADDRFRAGDTITCAETLKRLLKDTLGKKLAKEPLILKVTRPPQDYGQMLTLYRGLLARLKADPGGSDSAQRGAGCSRHPGFAKPKADPGGGEPRAFLLCAGGTPAGNTALLLAGLEKFRERATVLGVPEHGAGPARLNIGRLVIETWRRETLEGLLRDYAFSGIAADEALPPVVRKIANAAARRMNFDFHASARLLGEVREAEDRIPDGLDTLIAEAQRLDRGDKDAALRELYWNARELWRRDACADFLGRVWRLQEAFLQRFARILTGVAFDDMNDNQAARPFAEWLSSEPDMKSFIESQNKQAELKPNTFIFTKMAEYIQTQPESPHHASAGRLVEAVARLEKARGLRNRSIIAHGFEGLSREGILEHLACDENALMVNLEALLASAGILPGANPWDAFVGLIRATGGPGR